MREQRQPVHEMVLHAGVEDSQEVGSDPGTQRVSTKRADGHGREQHHGSGQHGEARGHGAILRRRVTRMAAAQRASSTMVHSIAITRPA